MTLGKLIAGQENRSAWSAGPPRRADEGLRRFCRGEVDPVFCLRCHGEGYVSSFNRLDPVKCRRCGGDGLEPPE